MNVKTDDEIFLNEMEEMLNCRVSTPIGFENLETEDDVLNFCLTTMTIALTNMLSVYSLHNLAKWDIVPEEMLVEVKNLALSTSKLAEVINYEVPCEEELKAYQTGMPAQLSVSPYITIMHMLGAVADISYEVHIEFEGGALWAEEEMPQEIRTSFCAIMTGMQTICKRLGISIKDIQS